MTPKKGNQVSEIEKLILLKEIWEKAVDTQMHFNEMCVKSRQLGLSFVVAALGVAVVTLSQSDSNITIPLSCGGNIKTHLSGIVVLVAALGLYAVKKLDLGVYHCMLRGAVAFGEDLESGDLKNELLKTSHGMTELISLYSRYKDVQRNNGQYSHGDQILAGKKIGSFYAVGLWILIALAILLIGVYWQHTPCL